MPPSAVVAAVVCVVAAALEGVFAGGGVKQRFAELKMPRWAPPLTIWIVIGLAYYLICFMVLVRVLKIPASQGRTLALVLMLTVLIVNGFWNFLFFRLRNLGLSFLASLLYSAAAVYLLLLLASLDRIAAAWLSAYVAYLVYANAFGYAVWRSNPTEPNRS